MTYYISPRPRNLTIEQRILYQLLRNNPHAHTAFIDTTKTEPTITIQTNETNILLPRTAQTTDGPYNLNWQITEPPKTLLLPLPTPYAQTPTTKCYPAPVPLGCQIQPYKKPWVGTAGGPIKFTTPDTITHWGFITNAHVSGTPKTPTEHQIHQPDDTKPHIGITTVIAYPTPNQPNTLDVALVDAKVHGKHKTDWQIINIGKPNTAWSNATTGTPVIKTGRTTQTTTGRVTATAVAAKIDYGNFIATLLDLDAIQSDKGAFSAPGDSGSLILHAETKQPLALLFAGSTRTTLAIPIRNIAKQIKIAFKP